MKYPRGQRVSGHMLRYARRYGRQNIARKLFCFREIPYVDGVDEQEQQPRDDSYPDQKPGNMNRDTLPPRTRRPLYEVHVASPTPLMARFTRFLISGIL